MNNNTVTKEEILVSVCCTSYNHASYIENTILGFIQQKTDFLFEVLIHDDASTDGSADIIKKYSDEYPSIIIPILQKENQFSQGKDILTEYLYPRIRGKFVAICEGDDYWIDTSKLQKQIKVLSSNPEYGICFHPAIGIRNNGTRKILSRYSDNITKFSVDDVIIGGGDFMPTASLVLKKEVLNDLVKFYSEYGHFSVGDVTIQFLGARGHGAIYIPIVASVYRIGVAGSWSSKMKADPSFAMDVVNNLIIVNSQLNQYSEGKYKEAFEIRLEKLIRIYAFDKVIPTKFRKELLAKSKIYSRWKCKVILDSFVFQIKRLLKVVLGYV